MEIGYSLVKASEQTCQATEEKAQYKLMQTLEVSLNQGWTPHFKTAVKGTQLQMGHTCSRVSTFIALQTHHTANNLDLAILECHKECRASKTSSKQIFNTQISLWWLSSSSWILHCFTLLIKVNLVLRHKPLLRARQRNRLVRKVQRLLVEFLVLPSRHFFQFIAQTLITPSQRIWIRGALKRWILRTKACIQTSLNP